LKGGCGGDVTRNTYNMHSNVKLTEGDAFRRGAGQMAAEMQKMMARQAARNK